jgi:hypothetical protein
MMPVRIQRKRTKGWRMPPNTVYVGRPSRWGNPWTIEGAREAGFTGCGTDLARMCVGMFRNGVIKGLPVVSDIVGNIHLLRGKNLACWCPLDSPCHADVLLEMANK